MRDVLQFWIQLHSQPEIEISFKFIPKILMSIERIHFFWATLCTSMIIHTFHPQKKNFISLHFTTLQSPFFTSFHFWTLRQHTSEPIHIMLHENVARHGFSSIKLRYVAKGTIQQLVTEWRLTGSVSTARQPRNHSVNTVIRTDTTTGLSFRASFCILYFCKYYTNPLLICLSESQNR